eukprot:GHVR01018983.1.p1 GENE.GHVR01018983.1~~GHVR01018983.1.p1  ORF type:complete len:307 (-),score=78.62 GHVR01018983.1:240-1160(-)
MSGVIGNQFNQLLDTFVMSTDKNEQIGVINELKEDLLTADVQRFDLILDFFGKSFCQYISRNECELIAGIGHDVRLNILNFLLQLLPTQSVASTDTILNENDSNYRNQVLFDIWKHKPDLLNDMFSVCKVVLSRDCEVCGYTSQEIFLRLHFLKSHTSNDADYFGFVIELYKNIKSSLQTTISKCEAVSRHIGGEAALYLLPATRSLKLLSEAPTVCECIFKRPAAASDERNRGVVEELLLMVVHHIHWTVSASADSEELRLLKGVQNLEPTHTHTHTHIITINNKPIRFVYKNTCEVFVSSYIYM